MPASNSAISAYREGPWYWVYLRPRWKLFTAPAKTPDENIGHPDFWAGQITPVVAEHYSLSEANRRRIANAPYGMPRGRVCQIRPWESVVYFGADMPHTLRILNKRLAVENAFKATPAVWRLDEHECMQEADRSLLANVLGL
ncbi:MAG: hypothetical protein V1899_13015 [Planctomycetota bacterium]